MSDRWIREGRERHSPLLASVRDELLQSYRALYATLVAGGAQVARAAQC